MNKVCVVIPYFQRERGILRKAVDSVNRQAPGIPITLCIVDDGSPIPATEELSGFDFQADIDLNIIEQENGGPAEARNVGLDYADEIDATYVAFLDSDDKWSGDHLTNAIRTIGSRHDLYFADFYQQEQDISVFENSCFPGVSFHRAINEEGDLFLYIGNFFNQILDNYILGTSTIVFRREKFKALRFDEDFVNAGEDHLFWLDMALAQPSVCFSIQAEAYYGKGVNIWASGKWGSENHLKVLYYEIKLGNKLLKDYPLSDIQNQVVRKRNRDKMYAVVQDMLHRVANGKRLDTAQLGLLIGENMRFLLLSPYFILRTLVDRFRAVLAQHGG